MAEVVGVRCPRCGAGLQVASGAETATCAYCGMSSLLGQKPPPPPQVQADAARIQVTAPETRSGRSIGGAVAAAGMALGIASAVVVQLRSAGVIGSQVAPDRERINADGISRTSLAAADLHHMDITDVVAQARPVALAIDRHAKLTGVVVRDAVGGLVDATGDNTADVTYEYRYTDPSKPPGQDVVAGQVILAVYAGEFRTLSSTSSGAFEPTYVDEPKCKSAQAWQTAVKSGVVANARATLHLYDNRAFSPQPPTVWSVRVDGHDEYRREIDAMTCALVKSWAK